MKIKLKLIFLPILLSCIFCTCQDINLDSHIQINNDLIITTPLSKTSPFVGIGPQWGGYDNVQRWTGSETLSQEDWNKLFQRVEFLRPGLIRIMTSQGWNYIIDGEYNVDKSAGILFPILDFCEKEGMNVMFGEWGEDAINGNEVDTEWLNRSTDFLDFLLNTKGYTCIKYYNMCNEPAGSWSSIGGNYDLWQKTYEEIFSLLEKKGLTGQITVIAPDVAVWNDTNLADWITRPRDFFGEKIRAYDIHAYPTDDQVKGGTYKSMLTAYRDLVPDNKEMIMGELGFKYNSTSDLGKENLERIANDRFAGDDSQMMVYDAFYGIDIAEAVIHTMEAGYNGIILWNMDDAMYEDGTDKLKRWGFWNILGEEKFENPDDENIRPWFYPVSLLCRYFPAGSTIYKAELPDKKGLQAIAAMKDGKYTIAICNSNAVTYSINLKMETPTILTDANYYKYIAGEGAEFEGKTDNNGFALPEWSATIDFSIRKSYPLTIEGYSFNLLTTMD